MKSFVEIKFSGRAFLKASPTNVDNISLKSDIQIVYSDIFNA